MKTSLSIMMALLFIGIFLAAGPALGKNESSSAANHWTAPASAKEIQNPLKSNADAVAAGEKLFKQQCATCHGNTGKGDGPAGKYLGKKLPDFSSSDFAGQSDGEIFWKITNGNSPMPTFSTMLTEQQRWQVVNFIRTFASH